MKKNLFFAATCCVCFSFTAWARGNSFEEPFRIKAGDNYIDTDTGHAAPFVADYDGDGKHDLMVGQFGQGKLKLYKNTGTNVEPNYDSPIWLKAGGTLAKVPTGWCIGFTPQFVDFNADGRKDIISGSWPGELYLFTRLEDDRYAAPQKIKDSDGSPLVPGKASTAFATDWDQDGDLDLLCGTIDGKVLLSKNVGTADKPAYDTFQQIEADGEPLDFMSNGGGDSGPIMADWDGDGREDLIVGTGNGGVWWSRNKGKDEPVLEAPRVLIAGSAGHSWGNQDSDEGPADKKARCGMRVKVCATDYNQDGLMDLVVGDFNMQTSRKRDALTAEEKKERDELKAKMAELFQELQAEVEKQLGKEVSEIDFGDEDQQKQYQATYLKVYEEHGDALNAIQQQLSKYEINNRPEYHGWVWVFLRKQS